jgi:MFS family permease
LRGLPGPAARCPECGFVNETDSADWWWQQTRKSGRPPLARAGLVAAIGWTVALVAGLFAAWQYRASPTSVSYFAIFFLVGGVSAGLMSTIIFFRTADREKRVGTVYLLYQLSIMLAIVLLAGVVVGAFVGFLAAIVWIRFGDYRDRLLPDWIVYAGSIIWFTLAYLAVRLPGAWLLRKGRSALDEVARFLPRQVSEDTADDAD